MYRVEILDGERMVATYKELSFVWWGDVGWVGGSYIDVMDGKAAIAVINTRTREEGPSKGFRAPFTEEVFRKHVDRWIEENL
jgi:hypothetical protein